MIPSLQMERPLMAFPSLWTLRRILAQSSSLAEIRCTRLTYQRFWCRVSVKLLQSLEKSRTHCFVTVTCVAQHVADVFAEKISDYITVAIREAIGPRVGSEDHCKDGIVGRHGFANSTRASAIRAYNITYPVAKQKGKMRHMRFPPGIPNHS